MCHDHGCAALRQGLGYESKLGGDLKAAPGGKTPTFMLFALKDPEGANLDRIQVVKGWLDKQGKTHEKVFNVVMRKSQGTHSSALQNFGFPCFCYSKFCIF
jgi:hypothetical protein